MLNQKQDILETLSAKGFKYRILENFAPQNFQICVGYWKTDHNVTQSKVHFIVPANSHTHALPMQSVFARLSWLVCFSRRLLLTLWNHVWVNGANRGHQMGVMALEFCPLPVRHLFCPVDLSRLSVDTSWHHSYSKQSIQVCFTTSLPPVPPPALHPPAHPLVTLSMKFMLTWKILSQSA